MRRTSLACVLSFQLCFACADELDDRSASRELDPSTALDAAVDAGGAWSELPPYDDELPPAMVVDAGRAKPDAAGPAIPVPMRSPERKPKCAHKPSQVMVIGDSYINWISHSFPRDLDALTGGGWRMEAIGGFSMGSGGIGSIPSQFARSIERDPDAHTVLMDGGGNDILVPDPTLDLWGDCKTERAATLPQCQAIVQKAIAAADTLLARASAAGIRDVVYFFYPHVPTGTLLGGPSPNTILDYALPMVRAFCAGVEGKTAGKTRCHFVDMVPVFAGHDDWFVRGDIHENSQGSQAMAAKIWEVMKSACLGQPEASGCCEP